MKLSHLNPLHKTALRRLILSNYDLAVENMIESGVYSQINHNKVMSYSTRTFGVLSVALHHRNFAFRTLSASKKAESVMRNELILFCVWADQNDFNVDDGTRRRIMSDLYNLEFHFMRRGLDRLSVEDQKYVHALALIVGSMPLESKSMLPEVRSFLMQHPEKYPIVIEYARTRDLLLEGITLEGMAEALKAPSVLSEGAL